ncbi:hypothetical protein PINS_up005032 [Pythium insidiosum]|nr:hypothetical protein PINS_up005032 [Pythium insidiosum]
MVNLDGDQKHEVGRGVDWLVHRLARLSDTCRQALEQHLLTRRSSREEEDRKALMARKRKEAQMRAMQQMQARQAAFAEQMRAMLAGNPDGDDENGMDDDSTNGTMDDRGDDSLAGIPRRRKSSKEYPAAARTRLQSDAGCADEDVVMDDSDDEDSESKPTLPECAMCHSVESENSFMCFVGFAQCSPVFSRLNGGTIGAAPGAASSGNQNSSPGTASHSRYLSTPMDEMHVGEDVPVHVRLCGHSVHHTCWESYHASQFQRAITGGHHRHALNAVDVTKKEFLCPLCKSISNVLIPTVSPHGVAEMVAMSHDDSQDAAQGLGATYSDMLQWLDQIGRHQQLDSNASNEVATEHKTEQPSQSSVSRAVPPALGPWLRDGLSSLCMAVHKVACGATQKSRPDRYTSSACLALFHTLLCTFIGAPERDAQLRPERRFFDAMRYIPLMLDEVAPVARGGARGTDVNMTTADLLRKRIAELLFFGGSVIMPDGTVVLEDEHPSTQTQTRKQSQWGKVRWPVKPLLLSQLGSVLTRGVLLAKSDRDAVFVCRMIILARIIQTLLWFSLARQEDFTDGMMDDLEYSADNVQALLDVLVEDPAQRNETSGTACLEAIRYAVMSSCGDVFGPRDPDRKPTADGKLLNLVASEAIPMMRVATFLIQSRSTLGSRLHEPLKPTVVSNDAMRSMGFVPIDALAAQVRDQRNPSPLCQILARWVARFRDAYTEMNDPQGILQQWLTNANLHKTSPTVPTSSPSSSLTNVHTVATTTPKRLTYSLVLTRDLNTVYTSMSVYSSGANRTRYLRSLPRAYVKFYAELARRKCPSCHQFPARPAVCLVCGMLLCAANTCPSIQVDKGYPEESNPGACTVHAKKCGRGSCMFLLVLEGAGTAGVLEARCLCWELVRRRIRRRVWRAQPRAQQGAPAVSEHGASRAAAASLEVPRDPERSRADPEQLRPCDPQ